MRLEGQGLPGKGLVGLSRVEQGWVGLACCSESPTLDKRGLKMRGLGFSSGRKHIARLTTVWQDPAVREVGIMQALHQ